MPGLRLTWLSLLRLEENRNTREKFAVTGEEVHPIEKMLADINPKIQSLF